MSVIIIEQLFRRHPLAILLRFILNFNPIPQGFT